MPDIATTTNNIHVAIRVANGGYIVYAWAEEDGDYSWTTSVFTDVDSMTNYVGRVTKAIEGPGELSSNGRLGNLNLPETQ